MSPVRPLRFDELDPSLADVLRPRYERLGYLGGFFTHMGHQPDALAAFERFTLACRNALPVNLAETIALSAATRLGNDYERHQHEHLAVRSDMSADWIADVELLAPDHARLMDDLERACQRFVLAAIDHLGRAGAGSDELAAVADLSDDSTTAGVALLTARFIGHAVVSTACDLTPPVPSIFPAPSTIEGDSHAH
ncbi:hypothetical protein BH23ACT3_BH23ACT3_03780 [soil metagenome]